MSVPDARRFLSTTAAGRFVELHPDTLRKLRRTGGGPPYVRIGRVVRYDREELLRWMKSKTVNSLAEEAARDA